MRTVFFIRKEVRTTKSCYEWWCGPMVYHLDYHKGGPGSNNWIGKSSHYPISLGCQILCHAGRIRRSESRSCFMGCERFTIKTMPRLMHKSSVHPTSSSRDGAPFYVFFKKTVCLFTNKDNSSFIKVCFSFSRNTNISRDITHLKFTKLYQAKETFYFGISIYISVKHFQALILPIIVNKRYRNILICLKK